MARWRREFVRRLLLEGCARLACWPVAAAAAVLALDRLLALPMAWRLALLVLAAACWAFAAAVLVVAPLLRLDWGVVLSAAEARYPAIRPYLKSAWDLRGRPSPHTSEDLRQAHLAEAVARLSGLPAENLFPWRPSVWVRTGAAAALLGGAVLASLSEPAAWQRVLAPWNDPPLESFVAVSPGDRVCEWGKPVDISARWTGRPRPGDDLRLWLRGQGLPWRRAGWDSLGPGRGSFVVEELVSALEYRVTWKDLSSRVYRLTPDRAPGWKALSARIRSPQGTVTVRPLSPAEGLAAYRGSHVTVTGEPSESLASASLRFSGGVPPVRMKPADKAPGLECGFIVTEDAVFHFELASADGRTDQSPEEYRLRALTDAPPKVELLSPTIPLQASMQDVIPVAYSATDDVGLGRVSFHVRVEGASAKETTVVLREFGVGNAGTKEAFGEHVWALEGLPHGAKAEFWFEAQDDAPRPQKAASSKGSVEIVDFESAHLETVRRGMSAENNLLSLARAHAGIRDLMERVASSTAALAEFDRSLSGLPGAWRITAASVADLASSMASDVYSNPGLSESMRSLAEDLAAAQMSALPSAVEASRGRDWAKARRLHERLAARLESALETFESARSLQSFQDFHSFSGRMAKSAEGLSARIEAARRAAEACGKASNPAAGPCGVIAAGAVRELRESLDRLQGLMAQFAKDLARLPVSKGSGSGRDITAPFMSAAAASSAIEAAIAAGDFEKAAALARRLADDLARMQGEIGEAAAGAIASSGGSAALDKARGLWSEAVDEQSKSLEAGREALREAMEGLRRDQKSLLAELAGEQKVLVISASAWGVRPDLRAFPAAALGHMKVVLADLEAARAESTPSRLSAASGILRSSARGSGADASGLEAFAAAEDSIRRRLESAPKTPPARPGNAQCRSAASRQAGARSKARRLQDELEALPAMARLPSGSIERVEAAQGEQEAAEAALGRGDSAAAQAPQEEALRLLEQGLTDLDRAIESQRRNQAVLTESFGSQSSTMRQGRGGRTGSDTGFVPLPRARDYVPPRAIRDELEKSLKERRPKSVDGAVKEYFKRIAQ
ncbi:MAG: hypothetical protein HZB91_10440 [Elusimicrobia bacterium]|nr:hypothetical protein [Elusimicrobiota bacterium]